MADGFDFAPDLYRGAARDYERYRPPYPPALTADLLTRSGCSGRGTLLDLACGTGQLAFALRAGFAEVWAVDQEPDMVRVVEEKAATPGQGRVLPIVSRAEELDAPAGSFELVTIGNAFHRLRRDLVAGSAYRWLRPGGHLALCWSNSPWIGEAGWQRELAGALERWQASLGVRDRVPDGWDRARRQRPDTEVLADAGFAVTGRYDFPVERHWSVADVIGFVYSTSFLSRPVVGGHADAFEADLTALLSPHAPDGTLAETVHFAYDLGRRPATPGVGDRPPVGRGIRAQRS